MLTAILEYMGSVDWWSFTGGLVSGLAGGFASGAGLMLKAYPLWLAHRTARRAEGEGSHFTVKDGVSRYDGDRIIRTSTVTLKSWTKVEMSVSSVKLTWPPFTKCVLAIPDNGDPAKWPMGRCHQVQRGQMIITPDKARSFNCLIVLNRWTRLASFWGARARIKVTAETIDAEARREHLKLRSSQVDWARPPQE